MRLFYKLLFGSFLHVLSFSTSFGQCPTLVTNNYSLCPGNGSQTVSFTIQEDANGCFNNGQNPYTNTMTFDLSNPAFQFVPATAFINSGTGDINDGGAPFVQSLTTTLLTIGGLGTNNGGGGQNAYDEITITVDVEATGVGGGFIRRNGGTFQIGGGINPAPITPLANLASDSMIYSSTTDAIQTATPVMQNTNNAQILEIPVVVTGSGCPYTMNEFDLDYTGTNPADVSKVKIYYSGNNPVFNPATDILFGEVNSPGASMAVFGGVGLLNGTNYFWAVVDVPFSATPTNTIDLALTSYTYDARGSQQTRVDPVDYNGNPVGSRIITAFSGTVLTVGNAQTFQTIQSAYNAIPPVLAGNYIIELYSDYDPTFAPESFPITFNNRTYNGFQIVIRPALGQTGIDVWGNPGPANGLIEFDNADYTTVDGRPGSLGGSREITFRNIDGSASANAVFTIKNGSTDNKITYCNIEGETDPTITGLIDFEFSAGPNGNSDNIISYNNLSDLTAMGSGQRPGVAIYSDGSAGFPNVNNTIEGNNFESIYDGANFNSNVIEIGSNTEGWNITGNGFYQTGSYANNDFPCTFINIGSGGGYNILNNYFGGQDSVAGGGQFDITNGTDQFTFINFTAASGGAMNTINGNVFANFHYTTQTTIAGPALAVIRNFGTSDLQIGAPGSGNTFGDIPSTADFVLTNDATGTSNGLNLVYNDANVSVFVEENSVGGIQIDGTRTGSTSVLFESRQGQFNVDNNTIGGSPASSINMVSDNQLNIIDNSSTGGMNCNDNTIQNVNHQATSEALLSIYNLDGNLTCNNNTIRDISTNGNVEHRFIYNLGNAANIDNNTIENINLLNTGTSTGFVGLYLNSTFLQTVTNNTVGGSAANNINIAGNDDSYGIYKAGSGQFQGSDNTIQNVILTSGGISGRFRGMYCLGGNFNSTNVTIQNIEVQSTRSGISLFGINISSGGGTHSVVDGHIENLVANNGAAFGTQVEGISMNGIGSVERCLIRGLENTSNHPSATIVGIHQNAGSYDFKNNVIFMDNGANVGDVTMRGIFEDATTLTRIYHSTIVIGGTCGGGGSNSAAVLRSGTTNTTIINNILQNNRNGGNNNYALDAVTTAGAFSSDYNFFENINNGALTAWGASIGDLTNFQIQTGGDGMSQMGTEAIDIDGYATPGFSMANLGFDLFTPTTVVVDKDMNARDVNPWVGAYEGSAPIVGTGSKYVNNTFDGPEIWTTNPGSDVPGCGGTANPCATIQYVVDNNALTSLDTIFVDFGVYSESDITINSDKPHIFGAGQSNVVFDGTAAGIARCFDLAEDSISVSNLTIQNYNNNGGSGGAIHYSNGGTGFISLDNITFDANQADDAGAIQVNSNDVVYISNCSFTSNSVSNDGGAIRAENGSLVYLFSCDFGGVGIPNQAGGVGGAIYTSGDSLIIDSCTFEMNDAGGGSAAGGAIHLDANTYSLVLNSIFRANDAYNGDGGAISALSSTNLRVEKTEFDGNQCNQYGSAIYAAEDLYIENSVFFANDAGDRGAIYFDGGNVADVINSTVADNIGTEKEGVVCNGGTLNLFNSIVYGHADRDIQEDGGTVNVDFCNYQTISASGSNSNNIVGSDPQFVNAPGGDYALQGTSPVVDFASNVGAPADDFNGTPRPQNGVVDMGAFEYSGPPVLSAAEEPGSGFALEFDGGDDRIVVTHDAGMDFGFGTDFTMEAWIRLNGSQTDFTGIISKADLGGTLTGAQMILHQDRLAAEIGDGASMVGIATLKGTTDLNDGRWHHVALVVNRGANTARIYVDGVQEASVFNALISNNMGSPDDLLIGVERFGGTHFNGELDEARLWDHAATLAELREYTCQKITSAHPNYGNLLSYLRFDDGLSNANAADYSGNSRNGALTNMDPNADWVTSGASIGDSSVFTYGGGSLNMNVDNILTIDNFSGGVVGAHIYYVNDTSNASTVPSNLASFDSIGYYGVFKVGAPAETYDVTLDYTGNPSIDGTGNEGDACLVKRTGNADINWTKTTGLLRLNTASNTITLPNQTGTEYVTGFAVGTYPDEPGSGYCLEFDKVLDRVDLPFAFDPAATQFTIEAWVRGNAFGGAAQVIAAQNNGTGTGRRLLFVNGTSQLSTQIGGVNLTSTRTLSDGAWYHTAVVYDGINAYLYINGILENAAPRAAEAANGTFIVGDHNAGGQVFDGAIDEVRMWTTAIPQSQIRDYLAQKVNAGHPNFGSLIGYYRVDDGPGSGMMIDLTGGNDGTLVNMTPASDWVLSGAYIGDSSVHNYVDATGLMLLSPNGGQMQIINLDGDADSLHLYYVNDTANDVTPPVGFDSLDIRNYWGIFHVGNGNTSAAYTDAQFDYNTHPDINGHPNETGISLVGRQDNSNVPTWGTAGSPTVITVNDGPNTVDVDSIDASFEIIVAYGPPPLNNYYVNDIVDGGELWTVVPGVDGVGCGTTVNPCATVQYVLNNNVLNGDTIFVDQGNYTEFDIAITENCHVFGAGTGLVTFDGSGGTNRRFAQIAAPADSVYISRMTIRDYESTTKIAAEEAGAAVRMIDMDGYVRLDSLIVDNCTGGGGGNGGGAFYFQKNTAGFVTVEVNTSLLINNTTPGQGGGILGIQAGGGRLNLNINGSKIGEIGAGNLATDDGGGIHFDANKLTLTDDTIQFNTVTSAGDFGGGISLMGDTLIMLRTVVDSNTSAERAAIEIQGATTYASLTKCVISRNENTTGAGAGIRLEDPGAFMTVTQNIFYGNKTAGSNGSAVRADSDCDFINCLFYENDANGGNGTLYLNGGAGDNYNIINCTFADNASGGGNAGVTMEDGNGLIVNTISWNLNGDDFDENGGTMTVDYCDYQTQTGATVTNSTTGNPLFVNAVADDYSITNTSAAYNTGIDPGTYPIIQAIDVRDTLRPQFALYDMGAYEFAGPLSSGPYYVNNIMDGPEIWTTMAGADVPGCGGTANPCATVQYVLDNNVVSNDTIYIDIGTYNELNILVSADSGYFIGADSAQTIFDGTPGGTTARFMEIQTGDNFLRNIQVTNYDCSNLANDDGAGVYISNTVTGTITMNQMHFLSNTCDRRGGAIYYDAGDSMEVRNSCFENNVNNGGLNGGAVSIDSGNVRFRASLFFNNQTIGGGSDGGAIYSRGNLLLDTVTFNNNSATSGNGGAVYVQDSNLIVNVSTFDNNVATDGGGIYFIGTGTVQIDTSTFTNNNGTGSGGAIDVSTNSTSIITRSIIGTAGNPNISPEGAGIRANGATLTVSNSDISYNSTSASAGGAGIQILSGNATIDSCIISNNQAITGSLTGDGAAISSNSGGVVNITKSFIFGNTCDDDGSVLENGNGTITSITNCLIYENGAEDMGALYVWDGTVTINSSTIVDNTTNTGPGGGIVSQVGIAPIVNIENSIVFGNTTSDIEETGGTINVDFSNYGSGTWGGSNTNNITTNPDFTDAANDDYTLLPTSGAINTANNGTSPTDDIIGASRPQFVTSDMGAYESTTAPVGPNFYINDGVMAGEIWTTNPGADVVGCGSTANPCLTASYVLDQYELNPGDTLFADAGTYADSNVVFLTDTAVVIGADSSLTVFDGSGLVGSNRAFFIQVPGVVIEDLTVRDYNNAGQTGGGINVNGFDGNTEINGCMFINNFGSSGGAVTIVHSTAGDGRLEINNSCFFSNNTGSSEGGAIAAFGVSGNLAVEVNFSVVGQAGDGNQATSNGGGIFSSADSLYLDNTTVEGNNAVDGGGVYVTGGAWVDIDASNVVQNTATDDGAGLWSDDLFAGIHNTDFRGNIATNEGGAMYLDGTIDVAVDFGCYFGTVTDSNRANNGGGIYFDGDTLSLQDSWVQYNKANLNGGGIYNNGGLLYLQNDTILSNRATTDGGGLYCLGTNETFIDGGLVAGNYAGTNGGGVDAGGNTEIEITNGAQIGAIGLGNNSLSGGGLYFNGDSCYVDSVEIAYNFSRQTTAFGGGGVYQSGVGLAEFHRCDVHDNTAIIGGGTGGGAFIQFGGEMEIYRTRIHANHANGSGSVFWQNALTALAYLENCLIYENIGGSNHFMSNGQTIEVVNSTIADNIGAARCFDVNNTPDSVIIRNSIIWNSGISVDTGSAGSVALIEYSLVENGNLSAGSNNNIIGTDPLFTNAAADDYTLTAASPAVDMGTMTGAPSMDFTNATRPQGGGIDMGAYESGFCGNPLRVTVTTDANPGGGGNCGDLRFAVEYANANVGDDTITFNISAGVATSVQSIGIQAPQLPAISDQVFIDGKSQNIFRSAATNLYLVEVDGSALAGLTRGFQLFAGSDTSRISHMVINNFGENEIRMENTTECMVDSNLLGTDATGLIDQGNAFQVLRMVTATDNTILGNVISAGQSDGLFIQTGSNDNLIQQNIIGLGLDGNTNLGNGDDGMTIDGSTGNTLTGNIISGNSDVGIEIRNSANTNILIGNYFGLDVTGLLDRGNGGHGIYLRTGSDGNQIGNASYAGRNFISGNGGDGIRVEDAATANNSMRSNFIGTNINGTSAIPNANGVVFQNSGDNSMGDPTAYGYNVISGNTADGVIINNSDDVNVLFSRIGTDSSGTLPIPNGVNGVDIVGGSTLDTIALNTIAFNGGVGIVADGATSIDNAFYQNSIHSNAGLGIQLTTNSQEGVLPPVITGLSISGTDTILSGTSSPNAYIQVFCDSANEGQSFIADTMATAGGTWDLIVNGYGIFGASGMDSLTALQDSSGNTSEFSAPLYKFPCFSPLTVTLTTDAVVPTGQCGDLRFAINYANTNVGDDTIVFNISAGAATTVQTIQINAAQSLPTINDQVFIDGGSQNVFRGAAANLYLIEIDGSVKPFASNNFTLAAGADTSRIHHLSIYGDNTGQEIRMNNVSQVMIDSNLVGTDATGLIDASGNNQNIRLNNADNNTVLGNVFVGTPFDGVFIENGSDGNQIISNYIGLGVDGSTTIGHADDGMTVDNSNNNTFQNNVISGNSDIGVEIRNGSTGNSFVGNIIGLDATGTLARANGGAGLSFITSSDANNVGDGTLAGRNIISANGSDGIYANDADNIVVRGNFIGLGSDGIADFGNIRDGIRFDQCTGHTVGNGAGIRNVISGNAGYGIRMLNADNTTILGNFIGPDSTGMTAAPNDLGGIFLEVGTANVGVGNGTVAGRNVISGNGNRGIRFLNNGGPTQNNDVYGNYIGTDSTGLGPLPNSVGIYSRCRDNNIGDLTPGFGNVISGNTNEGFAHEFSQEEIVKGNFIGVGTDGTTPVPNGGSGVRIYGTAVTDSINGNTIAYNNIGIEVGDANSIDNVFNQNSIYSNAGKGIDITGAAGAQEDVIPPVITGISVVGSDTIVSGTSAPNAYVQIFCDSASEGQVFVADTISDPGGLWSKNINGLGVFATGNGLDSLTATQDSAGNTSEFSAPIFKQVTCTPLAGVYTIGGVAPNYLTFTDAVNDLMNCGISATTVFDVRDGTYNEQIIIPVISGTSATDTILFRSESADSSLVTLEFATGASNYVVRLDSVNYVSFHQMTLSSTGAGSSTRVIEIINEASNINFTNCEFTASVPTSGNTSTNNRALVGSYDDNSQEEFIRVHNNRMTGGTYAVNFGSFAVPVNERGIIVTNNTMIDQSIRPLRVEGADSVIVRYNSISTTVGRTDADGLTVFDITNGAYVSHNSIIMNEGDHGIIVDAVAGTPGSYSLVSNNTVSISGTVESDGLFIDRADYLNAYHNSILNTSTAVDATALSAEITNTYNDVNIINNIFSNQGGGHAVEVDDNGGANIVIDYNDLHTTGVNIGEDLNTTTTYANLALWQGGLGYDANSVSVNPNFVSASNLHLTAFSPGALLSNLDLSGIVSDDIDGDIRPIAVGRPVMGADEQVMCDTSNTTAVWTWTGAVDNDWFNCGNWDVGTIPGINASVIVPAGPINQPLITAGQAYCNDIQIDGVGGASLTIDTPGGGAIQITQ